MAAGKPIVSINLKETSRILNRFNCGLIANDWGEFELALETLYQNRELSRELGNNGRCAVEKFYNYELLSQKFVKKILKSFK